MCPTAGLFLPPQLCNQSQAKPVVLNLLMWSARRGLMKSIVPATPLNDVPPGGTFYTLFQQIYHIL